MKQLENSYNQSLKTINDKISKLQFDIDGLNEVYDWLDDDDPEKIKIKSQIQSKIYQKRYQQALQGQVDDILDKLHTQNYTAVNEYLSGCYNDGYIATMYDLHGQGIPLIMPIDQESVVKAVQLDSKISTTLYTRMGENVDALKKSIAAEVSRGIVTGATYAQVAQQIKLKMTGTYNTKGGAYGRALTIARTEGHRIQVQAGVDACIKAKEMGCDVVKQWDSTLDGKTRPSHRAVDGEIRELEKPFSNNLMFPGDSKGKAGEVVNCRCALLQRAKWALDEGELQTLKERAEYYGLDKTENFEEFKEKYLKAVEVMNTTSSTGTGIKNKYGDEIHFEFTKASEEQQKMIRETIKELADKYESELIEVVDGASGFGKNRSSMNIGGIMTIASNAKKTTIIHEFGHSLAMTSAEKKGFQNNPAFWKELRKVHREYKEDVHRYGNREYALDEGGYADDIDEFLAEGFEAAILNANNLNEKYPKKIIAIVDKYFKKK